MIHELKEIANSISNPYVQEWKNKGKAVIGYPCTFIPDEIIHAAGMLPFRLRGVGTTSLSIGDTYFGPVICSFPKCILQLAGQGKYNFLDGAVIMNGCDSMRRLDECWRKAGEDYKGTLPGYFHYMGVPHKVTDYSIAWFEDELKVFIKSIEDHFGVRITDKSLQKSIKVFNEGRKLLIVLDEMRSGKDSPVTGEEATAIILAGFAMPREEYNKVLKETISELKNASAVTDGRKRIMVVGSTSDDLDFIRLIEESGCIVVADTMCFGSRSYRDLVDEKADPVSSLARRYLSHKFCPRMFGYYKDRLSYIVEKASEAKVDGVILQNIRFCDLHGSENGIFERDLEAKGIPCMRMEREYGPLVETGRIKMRVDAFMERIA
jgi:benzoyl-CoA reductase subunit C